jgi:hypothetical protein
MYGLDARTAVRWNNLAVGLGPFQLTPIALSPGSLPGRTPGLFVALAFTKKASPNHRARTRKAARVRGMVK